MNNFTLEIWDDESSLITYYSVRVEGSKHLEMEKFVRKYEDDPIYGPPVDEIMSLLVDFMGEESGADELLFNRPVNAASELPPTGKIGYELGFGGRMFPLRLFCLRLSDHVVVLFNGGIKSSERTQNSPDLSMKMYEAHQYAQKILNEFGKTIFLDDSGRRIVDENGSEDIYI